MVLEQTGESQGRASPRSSVFSIGFVLVFRYTPLLFTLGLVYLAFPIH